MNYHFWLFGLCYLDTFSASRSLLSSIVLLRSGELKMPNSHLVVSFPFRFHDDVITFLDLHTLDFFCNPAGAFATSSSILNCSASSAALLFSLNECQPQKQQLLWIARSVSACVFKITIFPTRFFYKQHFFSTQPQFCLTFSWTELQMLLTCCLHISIIVVRHFLHLLYLCPWLDLGLFMSYLYDLFFIFIFIFVMINRITSWIQTHVFFRLFFRICPIIFGWRMRKTFKYQKFSLRVLSICLIFCQYKPGVAYKRVTYKESVHFIFNTKWI